MVVLDPELIADHQVIDELARSLGMERRGGDAGTELEVGDFEVTLAVTVRHGVPAVERSSRGVRTTLATFTSPSAARRFLTLDLSETRRSAQGLPPIRHEGFGSACQVEEAPTEIRLTWPTGSATFGLGLVGRGHALDFSWVATAEPAVIAASYGHLNGEPLFDLGIRSEPDPAGAPRPAGRFVPPKEEVPPADVVAQAGDDPALDALLVDLGWTRGAIGPTDVIAVADAVAGRAINYRQSSYAYASTAGPDHRSVKATFSSAAAARRYLVLDLAQILRMRRRLPALRPPVPSPRCTVEQAPTGFEVRWEGGSATFGSGPVLRQAATAFTWAATATSEQIVASYADPDGAPLFIRR